MAKIVIAGRADCPYFAKVELLADNLVTNLPNFKLHKIVKQTNEWNDWLAKTNKSRGWMHKKSPLVWRELVDRGGKGTIIGGANEFQEYVKAYYNIKSTFTSEDMTKIAAENLKVKLELDEEEKLFRAQSKPLHICITNASDGICYGMIDALARGDALGADTEIALHLYDREEKASVLEGVALEAVDLAYPLLRQITVTTDIHKAFANCSAIILTDDLQQDENDSKEEYYKRNFKLYTDYAQAIVESAPKDCKVLVAGNGPVNFNVHMMCMHTKIPKQNIVAVSRMVENRAKAIIAERLKVNSSGVVDIVVWGNAGGLTHIDVSRARVHGYDGAVWGPPSFSVPATEMIADVKWLEGEFMELLGTRRETVETALNHKATFSHAAAAVTLLNHWWNGSPDGQVFSLGVSSEGWYDVPEDVVFSYPVTFKDGSWHIEKDFVLSDETKEKIQAIVKDLRTEYEYIYPPPKPPTPSPEPEPTPPPPASTTDENNVNNSATDTEATGTATDSKTTDSDTSQSEDKSGAESDGDEKPTLETIEEDRKAEEELQKGTPPSGESKEE